MNDKPTVFFSYSKSGGPELVVEEVVERAKSVLEELQWIVVDPLIVPDMQTINEKVCSALRECDALIFVWAGNANMNIAFEAGFAEALGLPIIILKRQDTAELFADLGNREYISYPEKAENQNALDKFQNDLRELLRRLNGTVVSPAARELYQGARELLLAVREQKPLTLANDPLLYLKVGWMKEVKRILIQNEAFEVDTHYYPHCLLELRNWTYHHEILAIADISSGTEFFGSTDAANLGLAIKQRIFVIDWKNIFDPARLEDIQKSLERHLSDTQSNSYNVYLVPNIHALMKRQLQHPLGENARSLDVLIIDAQHVAGYVKKMKFGGPRVNFCAKSLSEPEVGNAWRFFQELLNEAVEFDPSESVTEMRRKLLKKYAIGLWIPSWDELRERPAEYFDKYDQHIRCWIPGYTDLLNVCQEIVHKEAMRLSGNRRKAISVLELGVGTGNLTQLVVQGFTRLNKAGSTIRENAVNEYYGFDWVQRMLDIADEKIKLIRGNDGSFNVILEKRDFWTDELPNVDIVFGSFVLHFLLADDVSEENVRKCFAKISGTVNPGGSVVFSGILPATDIEERSEQIENWRSWMDTSGLEEQEVEGFFQHNGVLIDAANLDVLVKCAEVQGLTQLKERCRYSVGRRGSPFGVIAFRKPAAENGADVSV